MTMHSFTGTGATSYNNGQRRPKLQKTGTAVCKIRANHYFNFHLNIYSNIQDGMVKF